jgi:hypothetical protein
MKILGFKQASDIFFTLCKMEISYGSRQIYDSKFDISFLSFLYFQESILKSRTDEWHTAAITTRVPSLGVHPERDFPTVVYWNEVPYRTLHSRRLANES